MKYFVHGFPAQQLPAEGRLYGNSRLQSGPGRKLLR